MTARTAMKKSSAKKTATRLRKMGFRTSVFKKKKGFGISVTRK